ncbi:MAG TPA: hypothetical protein VG848_12610 [Acetobacteraceae bacterium]|nr:hypothetical protein [Acetobacteraceae bacterium]
MPREARSFRYEDRQPASLDLGPAIAAIAHAEGWLQPLPPITRITLRPWQRAVFWGLRVYIAIMLIVMGWGFVHATGG